MVAHGSQGCIVISTTVCLTNEHKPDLYASKKCCIAVVMNNNQTETQTNRGSFLCVNPDRVSVRSSRDTISALAIDLSGIGTLFFGLIFPPFDPKPSSRESQAFHRCCTAF
ncbi:MAG: hypothetical protein EXX96DRAFT_555672 [Benjaminiella poitrasii]|nr:MAG: hypothetical protein EXX96DRAFT_555672 [Benjaminiella poitrasii]